MAGLRVAGLRVAGLRRLSTISPSAPSDGTIDIMVKFSRGAREAKPNPMAAKLAGVVPQVPVERAAAPVGSAPTAEHVSTAELDGPVDGPSSADQGVSGRSGRAARSAATGLEGAVPVAQGAPSVFALPAGYNLPSPDPFTRNRQRVGRRFGEVVVTEGTAVLRLKRKRVGRFIPAVTVLPEDTRRVSPTQTDFVGNHKGVVFERLDGEHLYVWVDEPAPLLTVLSIHGFEVVLDPVEVTRAG